MNSCVPISQPAGIGDRPLPITHSDFAFLEPIVREIVGPGKTLDGLAIRVGTIIRAAIDRTIDTPGMRRYFLSQVDKNEKTHIGTRVEIAFREFLECPHGREMDLLIGGHEVDIKHSIGTSWMVPEEAVRGNFPCILITEDEEDNIFSVGLMVARKGYLGSENKDKKRGIPAPSRRQNAWWILENRSYPRNPWLDIPDTDRDYIMEPTAGTERMTRLFERYQQRIMPRKLIVDVGADQQDPLRRIRRGGGARDDGSFVILSGEYHKCITRQLGLPDLKKGEYMSYTPKDENEKKLIESLWPRR